MTQFTLSTLLRISASSLLILPALLAAEIGEKCRDDFDCNDGQCGDGICQDSSAFTESPEMCGNKTCYEGEFCVYPLVMCVEGTACEAPPPQCVSVVDVRVLESPPEPIDKCETARCKSGYRCEVFLPYCDLVRCYAARALCVHNEYITPCANTTCEINSLCVPSKADINKAQCVNINPCGTIGCKSGYKCKVFDDVCRGGRCSPPKGKCVPDDYLTPCARTTCAIKSYCTESYNDPNEAICVPLNPCATIKCKQGYRCQTYTVNCLTPPCTPYYGQCVPANPCKPDSCPTGYDCVPDENNPTRVKCDLKDLCSTVKCKKGYKCQVNIKYCKKPPCPSPYAECVPINPCLNTTCKSSFICTQTRNDPAVAQCVRSPCSRVRCGSQCTDIVEYCLRAPCPRPRPYCNNDHSENPCALVDCRDKFECINVPVTECQSPPCSKYKAECKPVNPCGEILCNKDDQCLVEESPCESLPCTKHTVCVSPNKTVT